MSDPLQYFTTSSSGEVKVVQIFLTDYELVEMSHDDYVRTIEAIDRAVAMAPEYGLTVKRWHDSVRRIEVVEFSL